MTYAGVEITDTDSLMAVADLIDDTDEAETWVNCPECGGARSVTDYCAVRGWVTIECPCCEGWGTIPDLGDDCDDRDPEPPTPAAPAPAVVVPLFRCLTCSDTGRTVKPSTLFAGKAVAGFRPDCTPHFDFAGGRFANCGGDAGEASSANVVPFRGAA